MQRRFEGFCALFISLMFGLSTVQSAKANVRFNLPQKEVGQAELENNDSSIPNTNETVEDPDRDELVNTDPSNLEPQQDGSSQEAVENNTDENSNNNEAASSEDTPDASLSELVGYWRAEDPAISTLGFLFEADGQLFTAYRDFSRPDLGSFTQGEPDGMYTAIDLQISENYLVQTIYTIEDDDVCGKVLLIAKPNPAGARPTEINSENALVFYLDRADNYIRWTSTEPKVCSDRFSEANTET